VVGVWTIEVGGTARPYKSIDFERRLKRKSPTKFRALIQYYSGIDYFDLVQIKRDGTVEWKGFVETIKIEWDEDGRYLNINGRDTTVILWKKYIENFSNMHEDTAGFFGQVEANELVKFLLRTPKSDSVNDFPNNKEGWGIDNSKISCSATRTSVGDPNWTILRRRGFGWRNTGVPYNPTSLDVDGIISIAWSVAGAYPYLDAEDDANYIYSNTVDQEGIFTFSNIDINATNINETTLYVAWKPDRTWFPWDSTNCEVWISPDSGTTWIYIATFGGRSSPWYSNPWRRWSWDVSQYLDTVSKINVARVKFINKSSALTTYITHAYLGVSYQTGGDQNVEDKFDITFPSETIMGVYIESRMDNDSYPRNYKIVTVDEEKEDFDTDYSEVDPNTHINAPSDYHIDFDAYNNETAYMYRDFGANYFAEYFKHIIDFDVITDPIPDPAGGNGLMAGVYCLTNALGDLLAIELTGTFINVVVYRDPADVIAGGLPCLRVGANGSFSHSAEIDEGKTYKVQIERVGDEVTFTVWEDGTYFFEATKTGLGSTKYRYLLPAVTGNDAEATHTEVDIDDLYLETETELVAEVTNNTFRDILHSWTPTVMDNIRIKITSEGFGWLFDTVLLKIEAKLVSGSSATLQTALHDGIGWQSYTDFATYTSSSYEVKSKDVTSFLSTKAKIDAARLAITTKLGPDEIRITHAYLELQNGGVTVMTLNVDGWVNLTNEWVKAGADPYINSSDGDTSSITSVNDADTEEDIYYTFEDSPDTSVGWSISQVYVYKAEDCDYRVYKEAGCTPTYAIDQYIQAMSEDASYSTPVGPLNIAKSRLLDGINTVVEKCHAAYVPYEWWLEFVTNNTFHIDDRKGSDLSGSISFVKGTNLEGVDRTKSVVDTTQRVRIMGRGKGKRSEDVSSDWIEDVTAMGNANTFIEDVISRKTEVDPDEAEVLGQIYLETEAEPKDLLVVYVSRDTYASMAYDVGDDVTITDSLSGASGAYRIHNIKKMIDDNGEHVTLYVGAPWRTDVDAWVEIYSRLKELELTDSLVADWMGEGVNESKIDVKDAVTTSFEKTAKNDTVEAKPQTDPVWWMSPNPTAYTAPVNAVGTGQSVAGYYDYPNGRKWTHRDGWMEFSGTNADAVTRTLQIELRGETGEEIDIKLYQNPKLVFELKCVEPPAVTTWFNGDYFDIGMYHSTNTIGYLFRIVRSAAGFTAYARWNVDGNDWQETLIRTLTVNMKYRFEIIVESKASPKPLVIFSIYELETETGVEEKYPTSVVALDILTNKTVRPLYTLLSSNNNADPNKLCLVYMYRYKTEWEEVK